MATCLSIVTLLNPFENQNMVSFIGQIDALGAKLYRLMLYSS